MTFFFLLFSFGRIGNDDSRNQSFENIQLNVFNENIFFSLCPRISEWFSTMELAQMYWISGHILRAMQCNANPTWFFFLFLFILNGKKIYLFPLRKMNICRFIIGHTFNHSIHDTLMNFWISSNMLALEVSLMYYVCGQKCGGCAPPWSKKCSAHYPPPQWMIEYTEHETCKHTIKRVSKRCFP